MKRGLSPRAATSGHESSRTPSVHARHATPSHCHRFPGIQSHQRNCIRNQVDVALFMSVISILTVLAQVGLGNATTPSFSKQRKSTRGNGSTSKLFSKSWRDSFRAIAIVSPLLSTSSLLLLLFFSGGSVSDGKQQQLARR